MKDYSFLANAHPAFLENLYLTWKSDPDSVEADWAQFFKGFELGRQENGISTSTSNGYEIGKELAIISLIHGFRNRGHLLSDTNPIRTRRDRKAHLSLQDYGLTDADLNHRSQAGQEVGMANAPLQDILERLKSIYCGKIGFEIAHIEDRERRMWLQNKLESFKVPVADYGLSLEQKKRILERLNGSVIFEKFLHTKYVGQKRFSLEGGECTIPALDTLINNGADLGVEEVVIGMAHRGRLNVLANIMGKTYDQIFSEFEGTAVPDLSFGSGDVKYHLGLSSQIQSPSGKLVQLKLAPNPSHLESVDPVVEGLSRAKADLLYQSDYDKILPILIHGDAAVAGQGIVYETLQMSQLEGFYTGGTIHFVINNQIGFTTDFDDARSSTYSTSVASLVQAPVFHVNGDDPEAVVYVSELAIAYRQEFNADVFIDMVCYRRHGHNEGDDPKFTQPAMYEIIQNHPNVRDLYISILSSRGEVEKKLAEEMERNFWNLLQERLDQVKQNPLPYSYQEPEMAWRALRKRVTASDFERNPITGISVEKFNFLLDKLLSTPDNFKVLPKVNRLIASWKKMTDQNQFDWATAELMAYASLLDEGKNVRLSGQDVKRGTFSHRHAVLFDEENNTEYNRLSSISDQQGKFFIYNSLLSEFAVLGFEYGYSLATPNHLVIWEAQFGDFANGAQVIFDQYIATAEVKWNRMSGLVLLLPHGYDGQGPEHSSGRLERYLQAAAELNIIVANVSTPANYFHLLRRQLNFDFRKPLIVMSPKSLFRHPKCISGQDEFLDNSCFKELIIPEVKNRKVVRKLLLCSGQVFYDLNAYQLNNNIEDVVIVRIEQLYPFPEQQLKNLLNDFPKASCTWVQEEPANMGAANHIRTHWTFGHLNYVSRPASASTAVGYKKVHDAQLIELVEKAFN
ncbi:MAG: 2-oxoglutarate dehydrogenase E1 component [Saprospiraceae bacterium]